ncbi:MAG: hypothetical protein ACRD2N_05130 [Vicinamibacterales bacterium]
MTLADLARRIDELGHRVDGKLTEMRQEMRQEFRQSIGELKDHMNVRFEETHRILRLGFEGQEILRESMERRFEASDARRDEQHQLLAAVARHLGVRVDALESREG